MNEYKLYLPNTNICLHHGDVIQIGRFNSEKWIVNFGWYPFEGNRDICGWYVCSMTSGKIKPIFKTDLMDCYAIS